VWEIAGLFSVKASVMYSTSTYQYVVSVGTKEGPTFLRDFAKLPKVTISFVIYLSVRPHRIPQLLLEGFLSNVTFECFFENLSRKIKVSLKYDKNKDYFT
jgi:hypothetical protein